MGNYRPVSILPIFSKVFQKLLPSGMAKFIDERSVYTTPIMIRKNKSVELELLEQKKYILTKFGNNAVVTGIFVGVS